METFRFAMFDQVTIQDQFTKYVERRKSNIYKGSDYQYLDVIML